MTQQNGQLLIVYNADGGMLNAVLHALHKQFAPETYPCSLCALTYGSVSMHNEWRRFLSQLPMKVVFHHRDDFAEAYPGQGYALPAIVIAHSDGTTRELIGAGQLDAMQDLSDLIVSVETQLHRERSQVQARRVRT